MIPHYFHDFLCTLDVWEEGDSDSPPEKKKRKNANISGNRNAHKSEFILEAKVNSQRWFIASYNECDY